MSAERDAERDLRAYYARRAAEYEAIYAKPERQADLARLRSDVVETFRDRTVLEVACGTGYWTPLIATLARHVVALDASEETLEIARSKGVDAARVRFEAGDAYALPQQTPRPDAAFAGFWWSHVPRRALPRFLEQLHAVLAPGARIVFIDNRYVAGSSTPVARTDADGNTYQLRRLSDGSEHEVLKNFPSPSDLEASVAPCAARVEVRLLEYYWWLDYTLRG